MPFPLAHPAAVLPFRRYCPRLLSFPALIVGSMSPDLAYFFSGTGADEFSHSLLGSLGFGLPVGMLILGAFYALCSFAERFFPVFHYRVILPFSERSSSKAWVVVLSLVLGCWTHVLLDSLTHRGGWLAMHLPFFESTVFTINSRKVRLCHLLWYGCSFVGMAWLFLAFRSWQETHIWGAVITSWRKRLLEAALVASLLVPIEIVHHRVHGKLGLGLVAALSLVWAVGIAFKVTSVSATRPPTNQPHSKASSDSSVPRRAES